MVARKHWVFRVLSVWAILLLCNACGDEGNSQECTLIGCESFLTVKLGTVAATYSTGLPISMEICVNTTVCTTFEVDQSAGSSPSCEQMLSAANATCSVGLSGEVDVTVSLAGLTPMGGKVASSVKIRDAMGSVVFDELLNAAVSELRPNGESCPPLCYQGSVSYESLM